METAKSQNPVESNHDVPAGSLATISGEVVLKLTTPVSLKSVARLYAVLQSIPEVRIIQTAGTLERGAQFVLGVDKPIQLLSILSSKLTGTEVKGETVVPKLTESLPFFPQGQPPKIVTRLTLTFPVANLQESVND